eukprot:CAMPEP_0174906880 /NCGR_PEP_ID=MMETSP0167-20121228/58798_1 /TAXON_ID=38298 /ORGANISM="Rhodella maculata, Strain CCMP736" /LENGTH=56 /DNA_ID=CAMNT_0016150235 /DNA_START=433 /DNA_END=603 /DNA_ORIENTATION=+
MGGVGGSAKFALELIFDGQVKRRPAQNVDCAKRQGPSVVIMQAAIGGLGAADKKTL